MNDYVDAEFEWSLQVWRHEGVIANDTSAGTMCDIRLPLAESVTIITGFVGVSTNTILVFGLKAASTLCASEVSTKSNSML